MTYNPTIEYSNCKTICDKLKLTCPECKNALIDKLYHYCPFNENLLASLIKKIIWLSLPSEYNDPFEFLGKQAISGKNQDSKSKLENAKRNIGVYSLSEDAKNILMWSHYSDKHTGFCIEYERSEDNILGCSTYSERAGNEINRLAWPVQYEKDIPAISDLPFEYYDSIPINALTKADYWKYEREWRVIFPEGGSLIPFDAPITSILFGLHMPATNRGTIYRILGDTVNYQEACMVPNEYRLYFRRVGKTILINYR